LSYPGLLTILAKSIANNDTNTICWKYCWYQYRYFCKKYWRYFYTNTFNLPILLMLIQATYVTLQS